MKSMTGFGRATLPVTGRTSAAGKETPCELDVTLRAVNGRYFEARLHAPREYAEIESELKKQINARIARGTVDLYVHRRGSVAGAKAVARVDLAKSWLKEVGSLAKAVGLKEKPSLEMLLKNLAVVQIDESSVLTDAEKKAVFKAVALATERCDQERLREGAALAADLAGLVQELEGSVDSMERLREAADLSLARKYRERLQKLGFEGSVEPQRLAQEIALILERGDVSEEVARLREHLVAYRKLLGAAGAQGKKLDFYAQELLREANTIGSKSHAPKLTEAVVGAKALIERIREQVQNAE